MPVIKVKGMSCQHCVQSVTKAIQTIAGVTEVTVDLQKGEASYATSREIPTITIKEAIKKIGFDTE